ncbi:MAG: Hsp20/alpha crystallin family protein [Ideonella sp.]
MTSQAVTRRPEDKAAAQRNEESLLPQVDVIEDPSGITLYADLPGVPKDKLDVRVDGETLVIEAELGLALPADLEPSHAEVRRKGYRRAFTLSRELDADKVTAEFSNGVLRLNIPKAAHAQPRRISVQSA